MLPRLARREVGQTNIGYDFNQKIEVVAKDCLDCPFHRFRHEILRQKLYPLICLRNFVFHPWFITAQRAKGVRGGWRDLRGVSEVVG